MAENSSNSFSSGFSSSGFDFGAGAINIGLQNLWNQKLIDEQNQYNSPASQMARYQAAGLNPNLIYGQGTPGNQAQVAEVRGPFGELGGYIHRQVMIQNLKKQGLLLDKELSAKDAIIDNYSARTENARLDSIMKNLNNIARESQRPYFSEQAKYQTQAMEGRVRMLLLSMEAKRLQMQNLKIDNQIKSSIFSERDYYNRLRQMTGTDRQDPYWIRSGINLGTKGYDFLKKIFD